MALSNTAVPRYYGMFRDAVVRGEIPVNREVSLQMNLIDDLIDDPGCYYDDEAVEGFLKDYAASAQYVNEHVDEAAQLIEKYNIVKAAVAKKALPQCNIVFETGDEMKTDLETYFNVLYAADPTSVGGQLPADDFYYAG